MRLIICAVCALILAACGGGNSSEPSTPIPTQVRDNTSPPQDDTPTPQAATTLPEGNGALFEGRQYQLPVLRAFLDDERRELDIKMFPSEPKWQDIELNGQVLMEHVLTTGAAEASLVLEFVDLAKGASVENLRPSGLSMRFDNMRGALSTTMTSPNDVTDKMLRKLSGKLTVGETISVDFEHINGDGEGLRLKAEVKIEKAE